MERDVPRTRARRIFDRALLCPLSVGGLDEAAHLVRSQIRNEDLAIGGVRFDLVQVRRLLTGCVWLHAMEGKDGAL